MSGPDAPHPALRVMTDHLHGAGRLRVWSIVISIFGDVVVPRGGTVAMGDLVALTERMGVEGGALRTAMSRLAKEGWVARQREGRTSSYTLTPRGEETFLPATRRIYARTFAAPHRRAVLTILPDLPGPERTVQEAAAVAEGGLLLRPGVILWLDRVPDKGLAARVDISDLPDWAVAAVLPTRLAHEYQALLRPLQAVRKALGRRPEIEQTDAVALRALIIHFWRRLVLRHPPPPAALTGPDWPGVRCHREIRAIYAMLVHPADAREAAHLAARFDSHHVTNMD